MEDFETNFKRDFTNIIDEKIGAFEIRFSEKFGKKFNQLSGHVERLRKSVR
jgi:hypothetical protein